MANRVPPLLEEIRRAILIFFFAGLTVELRVPKAGRLKTISGYFKDLDKLALAALDCDGKGPGVYVTLNPVLPALYARCADKTKPFAGATTTDAQIVERRWILVDVDPKRESGISATDAEHEAALERARQIRARLHTEGWPDPVFVDSGNGAHLLYRCSLPNNSENTELLKYCLRALAARHDDAQVEVDQTTFNAARICKLPGTVARKGDSTDERPHRRARVLDEPGSPVPVPRDLIEKIAAEIPVQPKPVPHKRAATGQAVGEKFQVESWIKEHGLEIIRAAVPYEGGWKWVIRCPFNPEHDNAAIFEAADGRPGFKCFHNSCSQYDWQSIRAHLEPPYQPHGTDEPNPTDVGNAKRLVTRHGDSIRYCHPWGKWLIWDSNRWRIDDTGKIEQLAKETVKAMFAEAATLSGDARAELLKHAMKSEHEQRIKAMIALARSERGIAVRPNQLDRHRFLLNVQNGTIDLHTGKLLPHRREDLITKLAPVNYDPAATAPLFMRFLIHIMAKRRGLIRYVQRAIGYSFTGSCKEQVFFVAFGVGANGKSTLLGVIHDILGPDYAMDTPADTFAAKQFGDGVPNDLARLKGARFVTVAELEGKKLDEPKLKKLTGQDPITARFMRAEFFQFLPEFVLWIACNVKPTIDSAGHAMWRRIRLIPFQVIVPDADQDKALPEKLRAEAPGILAWCVRGAVAWAKHGLGTPGSVVTATDAYKAEMDAVGRFLVDCCEQTAGAKATAKNMYTAYQLWCERAGETPQKQRAFGRKLTERNLPRERSEAGYAYVDIALREEWLNELNDLNKSCVRPIEAAAIGLSQNLVQPERSSFSQSTPPASPTSPSDPGGATPDEPGWVS